MRTKVISLFLFSFTIFFAPIIAQDAPPCPPPAFDFDNQADAQDYINTYGNCDTIHFLRATGSVSSLQGLKVKVIGTLNLDGSSLTNLKGLENVKEINTLSITFNENLTDISALNNLSYLSGLYEHVYIVGNPKLEQITAFNNLTTTNVPTHFHFNANDASTEIELPPLEEIRGLTVGLNPNLEIITEPNIVKNIGSGGIYIEVNQSLNTLVGFNNLERNLGRFRISDALFNNNSFPDFNKLQQISGEFIIGGTNLTQLPTFNNLVQIDSSIVIVHNSNLQDCDRICSLIDGCINGEIRISNNSPLGNCYDIGTVTNYCGSELNFSTQQEVDDFVALYPDCKEIAADVFISGSVNDLSQFKVEKIHGSLIIDDTQLSNLNGLGNLKYVGGNLALYGNSELNNIDALSNLETIDGNLHIWHSPSLTDINSAFSNLKEVGQELTISNLGVTTLDFGNLESIGRNLHITSNNFLVEVKDFTSLTSIGNNRGSSSIAGISFRSNNPKLEKIGNFNNLTSIDGFLSIAGTDYKLSSIGDFPKLQTVERIYIGGTSIINLPNFCSLLNISSSVSIVDNKDLDNCYGVCPLLNITNNITLENNLNCNDLATIQSICPSAPSTGCDEYVINHFHEEPNNPNNSLSLISYPFSEVTIGNNIESNFNVCADGSTVSSFVISKIGFLNTDEITLKLYEVNENNEFVRESTNSNADIEFFGKLQAPSKRDDNSYKFNYQHPTYLGNEFGKSNKIGLKIINNQLEKEIGRFFINIYRPPILFVPGIGTDELDFSFFKSFLIFGYYNSEAIEIAQYNTEENLTGLYKKVKTALDKLLLEQRSFQISCGKLDIIAHSTGGLLVRKYLQDIETDYKFDDDINKFITISTPHYGTQLADFALDDLEIKNKQCEERSKILDGNLTDDFLKIICDDNNIVNLATQSLFITSLNDVGAKFPNIYTHAIFSTRNDDVFSETSVAVETVLGTGGVIYGSAALPIGIGLIVAGIYQSINAYNDDATNSLMKLLFNVKNDDGLSSELSQKGGLDCIKCTHWIEDKDYKEILSDSRTTDHLITLLTEKVTSDYFYNKAFKAGNLEYKRTNLLAFNEVIQDRQIVLTEPTSGNLYSGGDVTFKAVSDIKTTHTIFLISPVQVSVGNAFVNNETNTISSDTTRVINVRGNDVSVTVPSDSLFFGLNQVVAINYDSITNFFLVDTASFFIPCPDNIEEDGSLLSKTYQASKSIKSSGIIISDEKVIFKAGESILLEEGFHAKQRSEFIAIIEDCPSIDNNLYNNLKVNNKKEYKENKPTLLCYPNPTNGYLNLKYTTPIESIINLNLIDISGKIIQRISTNQYFDKGTYQEQLNISNFRNGVYFIQLQINEQRITDRVILIK